jgi:hypothetical protein
MRNAFADEITQIAKSDPSVVLLSGDIGNRLFDKYKESNPDRIRQLWGGRSKYDSYEFGLGNERNEAGRLHDRFLSHLPGL